jgi:hypothetical protein
MSLKIGGSTSSSQTSSNSTSNSQFNSTTTPLVPQWASDLTQNVAGRVGGLLNNDPQSLVAPANGLQTQAGDTASRLSGSPWNFDAAADLTRGASNTSWLDGYMNTPTPFASGGKASDYLANYQNPYLHDVVDATAADLDASDGRVRAQQALQLAGSGAFGGSGAALTQSMTEGELARARASALGGLRSQAFTTALGAAGGDADRATQARLANVQAALADRQQKVNFGQTGVQDQLAAANQLASLSSAYDANLRGDISAQQGIGDDQRGITQAQDQAPVTSTQQIVAMLQGLPIGLFTGSNTSGTQSTQTQGSSKTTGTNASASAGINFLPAGGGNPVGI